MFVDRVKVKLTAGKGGNGVIAWRREKYIPKGGPYGGNGGCGGNIILEADPNLFSLERYRHRKLLKAEHGKDGGANLCQGKKGAILVLKVPYGTLVKDAETQEVLFDFTFETKQWIACMGGKGGKGNAHFKTATNRAPYIWTPGKEGEEKELELELKLIADVGFVGMPNAGKSTLMSKITFAQVKIAPYPFTTLSPNLSFVQFEDYKRILIADIPGIIQNAHQNKGLGLAFLRHVERTQALVFVLDIHPYEEDRDAFEDFMMLRQELSAYNPNMIEKPFLVVLNKIDKEGALEKVLAFKERYPFDQSTLIEISALEERGLRTLLDAMRKITLEQLEKLAYQNTPSLEFALTT